MTTPHQHGSGVREYSAATRSRSAIAWPGGGAEMISATLSGSSEARVKTSRHTIYATYYHDTLHGEVSYEDEAISAGLQPRKHIAFWPAWGEMIGRVTSVGRADYLAIFLDPAFLTRTADAAHLNGLTLWPSLGSGHPLLWQLANAIRGECLAGAPSGLLYSETAAALLSLYLLRNHSNLEDVRLRTIRGGLAGRQLRRVTDYMMTFLADDISLSELAAIADLSESHFCRAFKVSTGRSPHQWRMERRIERARELLVHSNLPVGDIATLCGFANLSHFGAMFRSHIGASPVEWRRSRRL